MKKTFISLLLIFIFLNSIYSDENKNNIYAQIYEEIKDDINFFYSYNCSNCIKEKEYLNNIKKLYPEIKINQFEISREDNFDNKELHNYFAYKYQTLSKGVPRIYISKMVFIGFSENESDLKYDEKYKAYKGCRKQIDLSIKEFSNNLGLKRNILIIPKIKKYPSIFIFIIIMLLYILMLFIFQEKLKKEKYLKLYFAGFILIIIIFLYVFFYSLNFIQIKTFSLNKIYPVSAIITAFSDGMRPFSFLIPLYLFTVMGFSKSKKESNILGGTYLIILSITYFIIIILNQTKSSLLPNSFLNIILIFLGLISIITGIIMLILLLFKNKIKLLKKLFNIFKLKKHLRLIALIVFIILITSLISIIESAHSSLSINTFRQIVISKHNNPSLYMNILTSILYTLFFISPLFLILFSYPLIFNKEELNKNEILLKNTINNIILIICGIICFVSLIF